MCPADLLVPKQLPTVKAIAYRAVTFLPLFWIKLTRNNHCERGLENGVRGELLSSGRKQVSCRREEWAEKSYMLWLWTVLCIGSLVVCISWLVVLNNKRCQNRQWTYLTAISCGNYWANPAVLRYHPVIEINYQHKFSSQFTGWVMKLPSGQGTVCKQTLDTDDPCQTGGHLKRPLIPVDICPVLEEQLSVGPYDIDRGPFKQCTTFFLENGHPPVTHPLITLITFNRTHS